MTDEFKHAVPDEILKHIGDVTVSFAFLETSLRMLTHEFLGAGQRLGSVVTAELSFKALRALAASLYLDVYDDDRGLDGVRELLERCAAVEERRNQITHSVWGAAANLLTITRIKITAKEKHGLRVLAETVSVSDLAAFAREIRVLTTDVQMAYMSLAEQSSEDRR